MDEYFDLCDIERNSLSKLGKRGSVFEKGEYHIVVMAILKNENDEILVTKRSQNKLIPGKWECTAGSVIAGETSANAIKREIKEEIGIDVDPSFARVISEYFEDDAIFDIWEIEIKTKVTDLVLQIEEVDEAKYVTILEIENMIECGISTKSLCEVVKLYEIGKLKAKYK